MDEAICVIPRSTTTNNNVFEIRHTNSGKRKRILLFQTCSLWGNNMATDKDLPRT